MLIGGVEHSSVCCRVSDVPWLTLASVYLSICCRVSDVPRSTLTGFVEHPSVHYRLSDILQSTSTGGVKHPSVCVRASAFDCRMFPGRHWQVLSSIRVSAVKCPTVGWCRVSEHLYPSICCRLSDVPQSTSTCIIKSSVGCPWSTSMGFVDYPSVHHQLLDILRSTSTGGVDHLSVCVQTSAVDCRTFPGRHWQVLSTV